MENNITEDIQREVATSKENSNYGTRTERQKISMLKRLGKYVEVE